MAPTILVENIACSTSDSTIKDFFSFCGKISNIKVERAGDDIKMALVTFEKDTAMKTALLLHNTQLDSNHISVTCTSDAFIDDRFREITGVQRDSDDIAQEEKPSVRILAECLAHGYVICDAAIKRAIEIDADHGVSSRFATTLHNLDKKYHASERAMAADHTYSISKRANSIFTGIGSYFEKAGNTSTGNKIVKFYTDGSRQVQDIHNEARRLANLKKDEHGGSAYKAAGLERVFGEEKEKSHDAPASTVASEVGGTASETMDPAPTAPVGGGPAVKLDETKSCS